MKLLVTVLFCFCSLITKTYAQVNVQDSLALVALYDSTNGTSWYHKDNWLTTAPASTWYGVTVTGDRVTQLVFNNNRLNGYLPHQIGNLAALTNLFINNATLNGSIPLEIGNLTNLTNLRLSGSNLNDTIPASFQNLKNLTNLTLSPNSLSGSIPSFLGNLSKLQHLELDYNEFSDTIPSSLGYLSNLIYLDLSKNKLTGKIPASLSTLSNLTYLNLGENQLTGIIPKELGNLSNLQNLTLGVNFLSDSIPSSLGNISTLAQLQLSNNLLTGSIPTSLGKLTNLVILTLDQNQLQGDIPIEIGNLVKLQLLYLDQNELSGVIPLTFTNLSNLQNLYLNDNRLSGEIPQLNLTSVYSSVRLYDNNFTFAGMEEVASSYPYSQYSPQASIKLNNNNNILSVSAGGALTNNTYNWYKDDILYKTIDSDSTLTITEPGKYYVTVNNSIATQLTLHSDTLDISTLPVSLISFTAQKQNTTALLQWQTANEINNNYFSIERSADSKIFTAIGIQQAVSKSNANNYSFVDSKPLKGINYYRLKQVDKDGKFTYSKIVSVVFTDNGLFAIAPNPAGNFITVTIPSSSTASDIFIYTVDGKKVLHQTVNANSTSAQINIGALTAGVYNVVLLQNGKKEMMKLVKK